MDIRLFLPAVGLAALGVSAFAEPPPSTETTSRGTSRQAPAPVAATTPATGVAAPTSEDLVGKQPPPITVAKWVKGEALTGFEKGKVYVVDFWATWCGPCKAAIPHLSKLAQEHKGSVEVIGVSISEKQKDAADTAYIDLVQKFVDKQGERMDYRVAVDTPDKKMHTSWFKPTGTGGIPTAYIIDQKGLVAWTGIGDPKAVERIVGEVLAGTFDSKKEIERQKREDAEAQKRAAVDIAAARERSKGTDEKYPGYNDAMKRGDAGAALEALNAAFKADPTSESSGAYQWKVMLLMQRSKFEEVTAYARELMKKFPENGDISGFMSAVMVQTSDDPPRFDAKLSLELAEKSLADAKPESRWQQFARSRLGWALYHTGNTPKAIEAMQSAMDGAKKLKGTIDFGDLEDQCAEAMKVFKQPKPAK